MLCAEFNAVYAVIFFDVIVIDGIPMEVEGVVSAMRLPHVIGGAQVALNVNEVGVGTLHTK